MSLASLPIEPLQSIAFYLVAHTPLGPPAALRPLLLVNKHLRRALSDPALHARIFRFKFDSAAVTRRLFPPRSAELAEQLVVFCTLFRFLASSPDPATLAAHIDAPEHINTALLMMLDNDGRNYAQLAHAGIHAFLRACAVVRLWDPQDTRANDGWPADSPENAALLWTMWLTVERGHLLAESVAEREEAVVDMLPFVVLPQRYPAAYAPPNHFSLPLRLPSPSSTQTTTTTTPQALPLPITYPLPNSPSHTRYPHYPPLDPPPAHHYFGAQVCLSLLPASIPAKLLFVARRELRPAAVPAHLPPGPGGPGMPLTQADFRALNAARAAALPRGARWDWERGAAVGVNGDIRGAGQGEDAGKEIEEGDEESRKWDATFWKMRLCGQWLDKGGDGAAPLFPPGRVYDEGSMRGLWQGKIYIPQGPQFNHVLQNPVYPSIISPEIVHAHLAHQNHHQNGTPIQHHTQNLHGHQNQNQNHTHAHARRPPPPPPRLFTENALHLVMQPMFLDIQEHHRVCLCSGSGSGARVSLEEEEEGADASESESDAAEGGCGIVPVPAPRLVMLRPDARIAGFREQVAEEEGEEEGFESGSEDEDEESMEEEDDGVSGCTTPASSTLNQTETEAQAQSDTPQTGDLSGLDPPDIETTPHLQPPLEGAGAGVQGDAQTVQDVHPAQAIGQHAGQQAGANAHPAPHPNPQAHPHQHAHAQHDPADPNAHLHPHVHALPVQHPNPHPHAQGHPNAQGHANTQATEHAQGQANAHGHANAQGHANTQVNAQGQPLGPVHVDLGMCNAWFDGPVGGVACVPRVAGAAFASGTSSGAYSGKAGMASMQRRDEVVVTTGFHKSDLGVRAECAALGVRDFARAGKPMGTSKSAGKKKEEAAPSTTPRTSYVYETYDPRKLSSHDLYLREAGASSSAHAHAQEEGNPTCVTCARMARARRAQKEREDEEARRVLDRMMRAVGGGASKSVSESMSMDVDVDKEEMQDLDMHDFARAFKFEEMLGEMPMSPSAGSSSSSSSSPFTSSSSASSSSSKNKRDEETHEQTFDPDFDLDASTDKLDPADLARFSAHVCTPGKAHYVRIVPAGAEADADLYRFARDGAQRARGGKGKGRMSGTGTSKTQRVEVLGDDRPRGEEGYVVYTCLGGGVNKGYDEGRLKRKRGRAVSPASAEREEGGGKVHDAPKRVRTMSPMDCGSKSSNAGIDIDAPVQARSSPSSHNTHANTNAHSKHYPHLNAHHAHPHAAYIIPATRREFERARIGAPCTGTRDILITGSLPSSSSSPSSPFAHLHFPTALYHDVSIYGRVRRWDGLVGMLRASRAGGVAGAPITYLFVFGYVVGARAGGRGGGSFVGEWRVAGADPMRPGWGGAFVMSRLEEEGV